MPSTRAPVMLISSLKMSWSVMMPTSLLSSETTGRPPNFLSIMMMAACSTLSQGLIVTGLAVIMSLALSSARRYCISCTSSAVALEGDAPLTSLSEMIPTTRFWSSTTGRRRIWCSLSRLRHFSRDVSGLTAMTLGAIQFSTSMDPPVEQRPCGIPRAGRFPFLSCPLTIYQAAPTNKPVSKSGSAEFHNGVIIRCSIFSLIAVTA